MFGRLLPGQLRHARAAKVALSDRGLVAAEGHLPSERERGLGLERSPDASVRPGRFRSHFHPICGRRLHRCPFRPDRFRRGVGAGPGTELTARPRPADLIDSIRTGLRRSPRGTSIVKVSVNEYFFELLRSGSSFFPYFQTNESTDQACCEKIARNDFSDGEASGVMYLRRTLQELGGLHGPSYLLGCSADRSPSAVSNYSLCRFFRTR